MATGVYVRTVPPWNKGKKTGLAPWLGKKRPDIAEKMKGHALYPGSERGFFKKGFPPHNKGKKWAAMSREKHWNWKGGLTPLALQVRHSFEYRQWRSDVFRRDDFTCQACGVRGVFLEADHIKRYADIMHEYAIYSLEEALQCAELWDINNGRTLCRDCHLKTDTHGRKKGKKI